AWQKYRMPVGFFRTQWNITTPMLPESRRVDKITHVTQCLLGLGLPSLQGQLRVEAPGGRADNDTPLVRFPDLALLHYGGAFARRRPSLYELGAILSDYFHLPAEVIPLTGQWLLLPREAQTQLGMEGGGILGENVVAGERIWDVNSMFRLRLGPLRYRQFIEYLPDPTPQPERKGGNLVAQLTRLYVGAEFDFEIQLVLKKEEIPGCALQDVAEGEFGTRLGWNTWLNDDVMPNDVDDVRFDAPWQVELPRSIG
ncbi:MAG: type VI secretion system baseplate subunit TssG, partial [Gemmataceae bacterium]